MTDVKITLWPKFRVCLAAMSTYVSYVLPDVVKCFTKDTSSQVLEHWCTKANVFVVTV